MLACSELLEGALAAQLTSALAERAALAQDNARLQRAVAGLQVGSRVHSRAGACARLDKQEKALALCALAKETAVTVYGTIKLSAAHGADDI